MFQRGSHVRCEFTSSYTHLDMVDSSTVTMVTAGVKEKGKKRSKSQKRADLLSVSPDAQDAEAPAHKAAKVSKDTAKGKKQKKNKERADASDQGMALPSSGDG